MILSYAVTCERARWLVLCMSFRLLFGDEFCFRADTVDFMLQYCNFTRWRGLRNTECFPTVLAVVEGAPFVGNTRSTVLLKP